MLDLFHSIVNLFTAFEDFLWRMTIHTRNSGRQHADNDCVFCRDKPKSVQSMFPSSLADVWGNWMRFSSCRNQNCLKWKNMTLKFKINWMNVEESFRNLFSWRDELDYLINFSNSLNSRTNTEFCSVDHLMYRLMLSDKVIHCGITL